MKHRFAYLALFAAVALPASYAWAQTQTYRVERQSITDRKAVIATVESVHETQARARIGGTITSLLVKEGDAIAAGEKIAMIGDVKLAIRGKGTDARVSAAQSAYEKAKLDFARAQELRTSGYGTQAKLDDARNNLQIAENTLRATQAEGQEVSQQSAEGAVVAPSAGRVLKVPVAVGSVIMAGETVATLSQDDYVLRLELPERHARFLKPGDTVTLGARGLQTEGEASLKAGTIRLVYPAIKDGRVIADVTVPDLGDYFVGERTRVYIATGTRQAYLVPQASVTRRSGISFVRLKSGSEIVVQTGQVQNDQIEVLSGLTDGDEVIVP